MLLLQQKSIKEWEFDWILPKKNMFIERRICSEIVKVFFSFKISHKLVEYHGFRLRFSKFSFQISVQNGQKFASHIMLKKWYLQKKIVASLHKIALAKFVHRLGNLSIVVEISTQFQRKIKGRFFFNCQSQTPKKPALYFIGSGM